jgi:hypothetical protein
MILLRRFQFLLVGAGMEVSLRGKFVSVNLCSLPLWTEFTRRAGGVVWLILI